MMLIVLNNQSPPFPLPSHSLPIGEGYKVSGRTSSNTLDGEGGGAPHNVCGGEGGHEERRGEWEGVRGYINRSIK